MQAQEIAVLGATGNQGSGVVRALLEKTSPAFTVRALTRDVSSAGASNLREKYGETGRLTFAAADVYDKDSLVKAFEGAYGVFAVTNNRLPGRKIEREADMAHELDAGRNIVDAAKECGVQHFVLSSLPNINQASNGRFTKVFHFDNKNRIEQWAKNELPAVTALHPGLFYTNMQWPQYCRRNTDGTIRFCPPVDGNKLIDWVDPAYDIGVYAAEIFTRGPSKTASKTYPVISPKFPSTEFPTVFTRVTSQKATFDPISLDEWGATVAAAAGKGYEKDIRQMMEWVGTAPDERVCYGTMDREEDRSWEDLGVRASTFEDWLWRSGWRGP
ncbi:hypothetical protein ASPSYDRAFT_47696 [Aspergillus sydowii CBS 593.65]|uniref:NmrA-like domain-containing protein n=1 Tax=Aspergillus sydowii CBS 593.65 TaxID=1036612 RepID=A0A1L9TAF3_9EURO|nr:uncharacterized protein ASPSYDRAFT_47696 [Aspergillus sydowii CBS 593.65]OJJ56396.1 hypothetical protein ASPSYDRAFT_47696 [Aspergillus sydowii CBS 593.65]